MTRREKEKVLKGLTERLSAVGGFYVVNAEGLSAGDFNDFRRACFQAGVGCQVSKNTLIKRVFSQLVPEGVDCTAFDNVVFRGFSGILFPERDAESVPAKLIKEFRRRRRLASPLLKGAFINQELFHGEEHLDFLSSLKSKNEMLADLVYLLKSPFVCVLGSLQQGSRQLAGIVNALAVR